jgi:hypothetical protein
LCIDPIDQYGGPPDWCSYSRPIWPGEVANFPKMAAAVKESTRAAKLDFSRANSISDVVAMFQEEQQCDFSVSHWRITRKHILHGVYRLSLSGCHRGEAAP